MPLSSFGPQLLKRKIKREEEEEEEEEEVDEQRCHNACM